MWHESKYAAAKAGDASNIFHRTVRISWHTEMFRRFAAHIPKCHRFVFFELAECFRWRMVFALAVRYGDGKSFDPLEPRAFIRYFEVDPTAYVPPTVIGDKRTRQNTRARDYLKAVTNTECECIAYKKLFDVASEALFNPIGICFSTAGVVAE